MTVSCPAGVRAAVLPDSRVVNGQDAEPYSWPWQVRGQGHGLSPRLRYRTGTPRVGGWWHPAVSPPHPDLAAIRTGRHLPPHLRGHLDRCQLGDDGRALHLVRAPGLGPCGRAATMGLGCRGCGVQTAAWKGCGQGMRGAEMGVGLEMGAGYRGGCGDGAGRVQKASECRDGCVEGCRGQYRRGAEERIGGAGQGARWRGGCSVSLGCKGVQGSAREYRRAAGGAQGAGWVQEGIWGAGMGAAVQGWMQKGAGCWGAQGQSMEGVQVGAEVHEGCRGARLHGWLHGEGSWGCRRVLGTGGVQWGAGKES